MLDKTPKENIEEVIAAINEVLPQNEVLADLCLTQAVHESNLLHEPSVLAARYNNLFGIKGKGLTNKAILMPTWEVVNGTVQHIKAEFAYNDNLEDSVKQWYNLMNRPRYDRVRNSQTLDEAFNMILQCGYATDPKYSDELRAVYKEIHGVLNG